MKRSWTALAVALSSIFVIAGCNDYGNTFQNNTGASVTFLSPSNISAGSPDFTITVNGSGFVAKTFIEWNGKKLTTTDNLDSGGNIVSVSAVISAALVAKPGAATVITQNPFSGAGNNGLSNPTTFIINFPPNPVPTLSSTCALEHCRLWQFLRRCQFHSGCSRNQFPFVIERSDPGFPGTLDRRSHANYVGDYQRLRYGHQSHGARCAVHHRGNRDGYSFQSAGASDAGGWRDASAIWGRRRLKQYADIHDQLIRCGGGARHCFVVAGGNTFGQLGRQVCVLYRNGKWAHANFPARHLRRRAQRMQAADDFAFRRRGWDCRQRRQQFSIAERQRPLRGLQLRSHQSGRKRAGGPPGLFARHMRGRDGSCSPTTQIVSTDSNGLLTGTTSLLPSISASGRFVAFLAVTASHAPHQQASSANNSGFRQVFVRDTCIGASGCTPKTSRISLQPGDGAGTRQSPRVRQLAEAAVTSHCRRKRPRCSRVRLPLTIAYFWPSQNPTSKLLSLRLKSFR